MTLSAVIGNTPLYAFALGAAHRQDVRVFQVNRPNFEVEVNSPREELSSEAYPSFVAPEPTSSPPLFLPPLALEENRFPSQAKDAREGVGAIRVSRQHLPVDHG